MKVSYSPQLMEESVFRHLNHLERSGYRSDYDEFHSLADPIYELPEDDREVAFEKVNRLFFLEKLKLGDHVLRALEAVGLIPKRKRTSRKSALLQANEEPESAAELEKESNETAEEDQTESEAIAVMEDDSSPEESPAAEENNDEIAYDTGGTNIPCGSLARAPVYSYHTDLDTPSGISWKNFEETLLVLEEMVHIFESNSILRRNFKYLPRLSSEKNDLYLSPDRLSGISGNSLKYQKKLLKNIPKNTQSIIIKNTHKFNYLMNCISNMCEGNKTILDIATHADLPFRFIENYINLWVEKKLITKTWKHPFK